MKCAIESVKTAADVYMPCDGKITKVNTVLEEEPQQLSVGAESEGWLIELEIDNMGQLEKLMDENAYAEYLDKLQEEDWKSELNVRSYI